MRLVLCSLVLLLGGLQLTSAQPLRPLRVGAWNIQRFGPAKTKKPNIMDNIIKIVERYDIILIQELQDRSTDLIVVNALFKLLNPGGVTLYAYKVSDSLGRGRYTERYLFVYNNDRVEASGSYQYKDGRFRRPPYVVEFHDRAVGGVGNFVLIPQHTAPMRARKEMNALFDVEADVHNNNNVHRIQNMLILGDFNAGCTYTTKGDWKYIRLCTNKNFHWLITNDNDTTVRGRKCAYDRIVANDPMMHHVKAKSAKVYNFTRELGITQDKALEISDHFPVEVELNSFTDRIIAGHVCPFDPSARDFSLKKKKYSGAEI